MADYISREAALFAVVDAVQSNDNGFRWGEIVTFTGGVFTKCVSEWCELLPISQFTVYWWVKKKGKKYAEDRIAELFCDTIQDIVAWNRRADNGN